ncbi:MAG: Holliday junction branch migration protein RuvA [Candidatus Desulfofervidaceae bacterium]|nr:Holliday junction branch migration protein RuvA [Candidatus Desulfofervidaceae bacterium]
MPFATFTPMIGHLKGTLLFKSPEYIIISTGGVGYQVELPLNTFSDLPEPGETVSLHIYTYLKENTLKLFGFLNPDEKMLFARLIEISGIGPKLALNILSRISPEGFDEVVTKGDISKLKAIPGIGRKTAERILLEMRDKWVMPAKKEVPLAPKTQEDGLMKDVVSVLINLGYQKKEALKAVQKAIKRFNTPPRLEDLIKETLRRL